MLPPVLCPATLPPLHCPDICCDHEIRLDGCCCPLLCPLSYYFLYYRPAFFTFSRGYTAGNMLHLVTALPHCLYLYCSKYRFMARMGIFNILKSTDKVILCFLSTKTSNMTLSNGWINGHALVIYYSFCN